MKWLLLVLLMVPAQVFASSADSGICPWKLPFVIEVSAIGPLQSYLSGNVPSDTQILSIKVDTGYTLQNDMLQYSTYFFDTVSNSEEQSWVNITFIPNTDSISFINYRYHKHSWYNNHPPSYFSTHDTDYFQITLLKFDNTSIYTEDSSFCGHMISSYIYDDEILLGDTGKEVFTATSATLSGIFRPTHYTCAESVSDPPRENASLKVYPLNNSLQCSFPASIVSRRADVYSVLGTQIASSQVPAGTSETTIANLAPGFYFVRLGNEVAKAIIP